MTTPDEIQRFLKAHQQDLSDPDAQEWHTLIEMCQALNVDDNSLDDAPDEPDEDAHDAWLDDLFVELEVMP